MVNKVRRKAGGDQEDMITEVACELPGAGEAAPLPQIS